MPIAPPGPESSIGATTTMAHVPDFAERTVRAAPSQLRYLPYARAYLHGIGVAIQALEDDGFALLSDRRLDNAEGANLDQWGDLVGEQRGALGDGDYRRFIRARILANRSTGTTDELIAVFALATSPSAVEWRPLYPAGFQLTAFRGAWMAEVVRNRVAKVMLDAKPLGIGMALIEAIPSWFGFEGRDPTDPGGPSTPLDTGLLARTIR